MLIYEVISKFFDDGKIFAELQEYYSTVLPENTFRESEKCDIYRDYFTDKESAYNYYNDCQNA